MWSRSHITASPIGLAVTKATKQGLYFFGDLYKVTWAGSLPIFFINTQYFVPDSRNLKYVCYAIV